MPYHEISESCSPCVLNILENGRPLSLSLFGATVTPHVGTDSFSINTLHRTIDICDSDFSMSDIEEKICECSSDFISKRFDA